MKFLLKIIAKSIIINNSLKRKVLIFLFRELFVKCGVNVTFSPLDSLFSYSTIEIGNNVFIGGMAYWSSSSRSKIIIGNYVMFGPNTKLIGGDHSTENTKIPMFLQKKEDSSLEIDGDIIIDDDVWIGAGAIILKGVHIYRGAIIGAGSIVTKDVKEYSVMVGIPAKKIKSRI